MAPGREIVILWAGRHRRDEWTDLCGRYSERIQRFLPVREVAVKARGAGDGAARLEAEGQALLQALPEPAWTVALDRTGKPKSSEELAAWLEERQRSWPHPIAFLLGSDLGLAPGVLSSARERLSLGPMTLPHELARLVLYEQIYRGLSIGAGIKYHRQPL